MPVEEKRTARRGTERLTPAAMVRAHAEVRRGRVFSAITATLVLHALVLLLAPSRFYTPVEHVSRTEPPLRVLLDPVVAEEALQEFSLTNPDVPANPPDEARFFSDRDQQAAQPEPTEAGDPGTADIRGEELEPTQNIVEAEEQQPMTPEEMQELVESEPEPLAELPEARPIPEFSPVEDEEGIGPAVTPDPAPPPEEEFVIGVPVEGLAPARPPEQMAEADPREQVSPRPRPVLPQFSRGPVGRREGAAPEIGQVAIDANFHEFGDYLARMFDVITRQWYLLAWEALRSPESGTLVAVSFRVDSSGYVHGLEVLHSTASLTATLICQDAISSREPYGPWTRDMREVLGEEQTIRIRFFYR
jgi:hypothetical protein